MYAPVQILDKKKSDELKKYSERNLIKQVEQVESNCYIYYVACETSQFNKHYMEKNVKKKTFFLRLIKFKLLSGIFSFFLVIQTTRQWQQHAHDTRNTDVIEKQNVHSIGGK